MIAVRCQLPRVNPLYMRSLGLWHINPQNEGLVSEWLRALQNQGGGKVGVGLAVETEAWKQQEGGLRCLPHREVLDRCQRHHLRQGREVLSLALGSCGTSNAVEYCALTSQRPHSRTNHRNLSIPVVLTGSLDLAPPSFS